MNRTHRRRTISELTDVFIGGLIVFVSLCAWCFACEREHILAYGLHIVAAVLVWFDALYVLASTGYKVFYGRTWHTPGRSDILRLLLVLVNSILFIGMICRFLPDFVPWGIPFLLCTAQGVYCVIRLKTALARMEPAQKRRVSWEIIDIYTGVLFFAVLFYADCLVEEQKSFIDMHLHILLALLVWGNMLYVVVQQVDRRIREKKWKLPERKDLWRSGFLLAASVLFLGVVVDIFPLRALYFGVPLCIILSIFSLARIADLAHDLRPGINEISYRVKRWRSAYIFFLLMTGWVLATSVPLLMPNAHSKSLSFIDALFTCASATSITGLSCINVGQDLDRGGQFIVMLDFQIGAIGVMTFIYFIMMVISNRLSTGESQDLTAAWEQINQANIWSLLKIVVGVTLLIETVGAVLLYFLWQGVVPQQDLLWYAVFHSVSAFCNAGITLLPDSFATEGINTCYAAQVVMMLLIMAGTLGFGIYHEAFARLNERLHGRRTIRRWSTYSWLVVRVTGIVLLGGTLILALISLLERADHEFSFWECIWNAVGRSAGFNLSDINLYGPVYKLFMCVLMLVGGNPTGTGGGIFAPVVALCVLEIFRILRGQRDVQMHARCIARATVERAMATVVLSIIWITVMTMLLLMFEEWKNGTEGIAQGHVKIFDMLFLEVSAFTTTGYSLTDLADISTASKVLLSVNMLFGRMGMFAFMLLFVTPKPPQPFRYPETNLPLN